MQHNIIRTVHEYAEQPRSRLHVIRAYCSATCCSSSDATYKSCMLTYFTNKQTHNWQRNTPFSGSAGMNKPMYLLVSTSRNHRKSLNLRLTTDPNGSEMYAGCKCLNCAIW